MALPHHAASAIHAVRILAEEAESLQKANVSLTEEVARLNGDIFILQQEKHTLDQEIERLKKDVEKLKKEIYTKTIYNEDKQKYKSHEDIFRCVFQSIDSNDGWVPIINFHDALKRTDPEYKSSYYWKGEILSTARAYPNCNRSGGTAHAALGRSSAVSV